MKKFENERNKLLNSLFLASTKFSPEINKIISNTSWLFVYQFIYIAIGLFIGVCVARYLGPEEFGLYNYAVSFVALASSFLSLGLEGIVIRELVEDPASHKEILGTTVIIRIIGGILSLLFITSAITLVRPGDQVMLFFVGIISFGSIFRALDIIDFWFQSQVQSKYSVYAKSLSLILGFIAKIILIFLSAPLITFIWVTAAESVFGAVGLAISYRANGNYLRAWKVSLSRAKNFLSKSWPLILSGVAASINLKIDQIMLGEMVGTSEVGLYAAAAGLSEVWYFIPKAITSSTFPLLVQSKKLGEEVYYSQLQRLYNFLALLSLVIIIPAIFIATPVITLLYGEAYREAGFILTIHIWASLFVFMREARAKSVIIEDLFKFGLLCHCLGALVNIIVNLLLIPIYGGVGAAIATVISYATASYIANFIYPKTRISGKMMTLAIIAPIRLFLIKINRLRS